MGNAMGCCADQSAVVNEKQQIPGGVASKKVMFGKNHEETESSDEDQSIEGKPEELNSYFFVRDAARPSP